MKSCLVLGGNGFIGHHMARRLKGMGYFVRVVDIQQYQYGENDYADEVIIGDLRDIEVVKNVCWYKSGVGFDLIIQTAADMGGASYIFSGLHDADILTNSALINLNVAQVACITKAKKIFYSSSACIYPLELQQTTVAPNLKESDWCPSHPDSDYGWEKIFSERLWLAYGRNYGLNVVIGRFHNIYGPEGAWFGGKEKAPAAVCRKVVKGEEFAENWGDGLQTRSFLYIDDCVDGVLAALDWDINTPVNIGSEESIAIQDLYKLVIDISGKDIYIKNIPMPEGLMGVMGRNSDNTMIEKITKWKPKHTLRQGLEKTYKWISEQVEKQK
jgi:GDP-D-mannose 3', 5'-epimerase